MSESTGFTPVHSFDAFSPTLRRQYVIRSCSVSITFWNSQKTKRYWTFAGVFANRSQQAVSEESTAELLGEGEPLQATDWNLLTALAPEEAQR